MKILMIVIKNTSVLDYVIPLFWKLRESYPEAKPEVLFCTLSRRKILRRSKFYAQVLDDCDIPQYDFADFLPVPFSIFSRFVRRAFSRSAWDSRTPRFPLFQKVQRHVSGRLEKFVAGRVAIGSIMPALDPDIILFDNRALTNFKGREVFYDYLKHAKKKVILLPHAPHHSGPTAFTRFDEKGEKLPAYCEYWRPFSTNSGSRSWRRDLFK